MHNHDKNRWDLKTICGTEYSAINNTIVMNYSLLTDIYHYLQSKSARYPWVDYYSCRKYFFRKAVLEQGYGISISVFDQCVKAA